MSSTVVTLGLSPDGVPWEELGKCFTNSRLIDCLSLGQQHTLKGRLPTVSSLAPRSHHFFDSVSISVSLSLLLFSCKQICLSSHTFHLSPKNPVCKSLSQAISFSHFFFFFKIYLIFIFDCGGSSLPHMGFSPCGVQASHCSGFFCCGAQALGHTGFSSCSTGLSTYSFRALECWLSSCGAQAVAHNMWELFRAGIELVTLALQGGSSSLF